MTPLQLNILIGLATVPCCILFNSCYEWLVHGPFMHGKLSAITGLRTGHEQHHEFFGTKEGYSNANHGTNVALPFWAALITLGVAAAVGGLAAFIIGYWIIMWTTLIVSACYYAFYQYVHTCMHIPRNRWLERTEWFKRRNAYHFVHHFRDEKFDQLRNICIVCDWADRMFGTKFSGT